MLGWTLQYSVVDIEYKVVLRNNKTLGTLLLFQWYAIKRREKNLLG
jgi:hypothetical protein